METRTCKKCHETKPCCSFYYLSDDNETGLCRQCHKKYHASYTKKNLEKYRQNTAKIIERKRLILNTIKETKGCLACHTHEASTLTFFSIPDGKKLPLQSQLVNKSVEKILDTLDGNVVLCEKCAKEAHDGYLSFSPDLANLDKKELKKLFEKP